jgi:hypothetical protein
MVVLTTYSLARLPSHMLIRNDFIAGPSFCNTEILGQANPGHFRSRSRIPAHWARVVETSPATQPRRLGDPSSLPLFSSS